MKGIVKRFYFRKGFGFIEGEPGSEYFFHYSEFSGEKRALRAGLEVEFEPRVGDKGPAATAIRTFGTARAPRPQVSGERPREDRRAPMPQPAAAPWRSFAAGIAVGVVLGAGLFALFVGVT
jgi:cold shock protein